MKERLIIILLCMIATIITRFLPFVLFSKGKTPKFILYLGKYLSAAIFSMLVIYCLKDVSLFSGYHGLPEALAIGLIVIIHLVRRNTLLSIATGTIFYMFLVQFIFR